MKLSLFNNSCKILRIKLYTILYYMYVCVDDIQNTICPCSTDILYFHFYLMR